VFAVAVDPLGTSLVASLPRPGGNVTGLSIQSADLAAKRLELLREVLPDLRRLAIMGNGKYPAAVLEMGEVEAAGRTLGLKVDRFEIRRAEDIAPAFGAFDSGSQALYLCADALINAHHNRINILSLGARLPTIYPSSLLKNLKSSAFVLRFSSSYKCSVRFGSECSRLVATLSL
jgi:putative tryptophan/tyrosine transport system substrate-binding protein